MAKVVSTSTRQTYGNWAEIELLRKILRLIQVIEDCNRSQRRAMAAIESANASVERLRSFTEQASLGATYSRPTMGRAAGFGIG
ncbi:hypothetical protein LO762_03780 [Actinocorallia sp. API 0066]|uniref:hypothetical protein n=1 Tax=Actinocorallia sp. API 0066 TaxID=2896846 RepID=UPI001E3A141B|nr:hypothetical protein [Actinocorallia sp. API 0066]MCD0448319.1 hypothetical protein [Actinocorallia sp. API 0066]